MTKKFVRDVSNLIESLPEAVRVSMQPTVEKILASEIDSSALLYKAIKSTDTPSSLRATAIWLAGRMKLKTASRALIEAFLEGPNEVAWEAAISLGLLRSKTAVQVFLEELKNGSSSKRRAAAAYALGLIGDKRSEHELLQVIQRRPESSLLLSHAAEALGRVGSKKSVASLIALLDDKRQDVVTSGIYALEQIIGTKATKLAMQRAGADVHKTDPAIATTITLHLPTFTLSCNEDRGRWVLIKDSSNRTIRTFATKEEAIKGGLDKAIGKRGGSVKIQTLKGDIEKERIFPPGKSSRA
jgi:hypothetical protein